MTYIIVGVVAGVLVVCGLITLVIILVRRRKSKKEDEAGDNSVVLESMESSGNKGHYQSIAFSQSAEPVTSDSTKGQHRSTSQSLEQPEEKHSSRANKSWEINYSELKMLETVGEGDFGTVHRALFRHQEVAVKQLKKQIDKKEVRKCLSK
jgi:FtsZ-interacting cell division protein ZipA